MNHKTTNEIVDHVLLINPQASSSIVLICEHATPYIPEVFCNLGLPPEALSSHIAWDPGAMAVAAILSRILDATLIAGGVSRLVYDCNRPPDAADAIPNQSEIYAIPGNQDLSPADKAARVATYYLPFRQCLSDCIAQKPSPIIVTLHSFTPVYHGTARDVEIGIVHDSDSRLADAMLDYATNHTAAHVRRNEPYGPEDGVTHTLKEHALPKGHLNVMLEIRNDLINSKTDQTAIADMLAGWISDSIARTIAAGSVTCRV